MSTEPRIEIGKCPACRADGVKLRDVSGLMICEKCSSKRFSNKVRKTIQEAFERQQDQKRREAWRLRMDVAKKSVKAYEKGQIPDALRGFREYIAILEARYSAGPGGLHIAHFNSKSEQGEILLVAGIYWDMAKIFDQMKGHHADMRACLNKFIEFSIDRPHVILASEAIRKYLKSGQVKHVDDFKNAHELMLSKLAKCFVASAVYGAESQQVMILRKFRDQYLSKTLLGRPFIRAYYFASPALVKQLNAFPRLKEPVKFLLNFIVEKIAKLV